MMEITFDLLDQHLQSKCEGEKCSTDSTLACFYICEAFLFLVDIFAPLWPAMEPAFESYKWSFFFLLLCPTVILTLHSTR